jgi:hypothetical protein
MPTNPQPSPTARKVASNALADVAQIKQALPQIIASTNRVLSAIDARISKMEVALDAVVKLLGPEAVAQTATEIRIEQSIADAKVIEDNVQEAVTEGKLKVSDVVRGPTKETDADGQEVITDGGSMIEAKEFNAKGESIVPHYFLVKTAELFPELAAAVIGKAAGAEVPTYLIDINPQTGEKTVHKNEKGEPEFNGGKFVIVRVLEEVPAEEQSKAEEQPAAPEAAVVAPQPAAETTSSEAK